MQRAFEDMRHEKTVVLLFNCRTKYTLWWPDVESREVLASSLGNVIAILSGKLENLQVWCVDFFVVFLGSDQIDRSSHGNTMGVMKILLLLFFPADVRMYMQRLEHLSEREHENVPGEMTFLSPSFHLSNAMHAGG